MNGVIRLLSIKKEKNRVEYVFDVSDELKKFFTNTEFFLEYYRDKERYSIDALPDSILAIPFVCNILPITWITGSTLEIPELDKDFCNSVPRIKNGYKSMLPEIKLDGRLKVLSIVKNDVKKRANRKSAVFFSGGVDSWCTLIRHIEERPDLISIWGSDVDYMDQQSWSKMNSVLEKEASKMGLNHVIVRSSFRKTIYEDCLTWTFEKEIKDNWWHGMQHGIAIIAHAVPYDYSEGISKQYIAATYDETNNAVCASRPEIDGVVRFAGCRVYHDALISRQNKVREIAAFCDERDENIKLHVCWESGTGENCMKCEKCNRTLYGFLVLGEEDIEKYGFDWNRVKLKEAKKALKNIGGDDPTRVFWRQIQEELIKNERSLRTKKYYKKIKWLRKYKF